MKRIVSAISAQIYYFLDTHRITQDQLLSLWDTHHEEKSGESFTAIRNEIKAVYDSDFQHNFTSQSLKSVVSLLQDTFGFELEERKIPRLGRRPLAVFAQFVGLILAICTLYIVLGGIATGQSSLTLIYGAPIWITYSVLILSLLILAALEGTQIAIVALTEKKVSLFRKKYPRGCKAIKLVNSKELIEKYLAGRQFGVIFVVFIIAQVTSFPQIEDLPFTDLPINKLPLLINFLGFQLGLFGALLVLWTAQLLPQFVANKNPLLFLNIPFMATVIRACLWLEAIGPTRPASWLSAPQRDSLIVPTSSFVKHDDLVDDIYGYEVINQNYKWNINEDRSWSFNYTNVFRIRGDGIEQLTDSSLLINGEVDSARFSNLLFRNGKQIKNFLNTKGVETHVTGNGWSQFFQEVNGYTHFTEGDVVQNNYVLTGKSSTGLSRICVSRPTKLISFSILDHSANKSDKCLVIRKYRQDEVMGKSLLLEDRELQFVDTGKRGVKKCYFIDVHPIMNTVYEIFLRYTDINLESDEQKINLQLNSPELCFD